MFRNYLAAAFRNLIRNRLYAGVTIAGLAIAFASAILIGLYLRHELTYDRFIPGHERVFLLSPRVVSQDRPPMSIDYSSAVLAGELKAQFPQIQYTARMATFGFPPTVRRGTMTASERLFSWADPDFFKVLPFPAIAGDPATALEDPDALVITRAVARRYFGQDAPIGGRLDVDGKPMRVAAVIEDLPSNSHLALEFIGSSRAAAAPFATLEAAGYSSNSNLTYIRLKPGTSAESMKAGVAEFVQSHIMPALKRINPNDNLVSVELRLKPLSAIHLQPADGGDPKPGADLKVLAGLGVIGVLIVVVAAINFVTLMTARAARRATEVGVRKAMGAERKDLLLQFMSEALIYVLIALVLAVALSELLLPAVNAALQRKMSFDYLSDPGLIAVMLGVVLATGLLAGFYPAIVLSSFRPAAVFKGGPVAAGGSGIVRQTLVVAQFAVLIVLILATATIFRQTTYALKDATRTDKNGVVILFASPCTNALRDAVRAVPGVIGAACSSPAVLELSNSVQMIKTNGRMQLTQYAPVDVGFFEVYHVRPVAGRLFQADHPGDDGANLQVGAPPIILNEAAVRALGFKSAQAAVGQPFTWAYDRDLTIQRVGTQMAPYQTSMVIGVIPDISFGSVRQRVKPYFYYVGPKLDMLGSVGLNIRVDPRRAAPTIKAIDNVWAQISHGQPLQQYMANQFLLRLYIDNVIQGGFIAACAIIAVSVACLGLFALSAYTTERRTKEIGVRKAMGASSGDILKLLLWQFAKPVLWANVVAWPAAWGILTWWLSSFAYHVDMAPWTFVAAGAAALVIALATVFVHARAVARAKPVGALRYE